MSGGVRVAALLSIVLAVAACYRPSLPRCAIACQSDGDCPGDLTCVAGANLCAGAGDTCSDVPDGGGPDAMVSGVWSAVAAGQSHACAVGTDRTMWCWGNNDRRQLGVVTPARSGTPVRVDAGGAADWEAVSASYGHSCGLRQDGTLWCWGLNDELQCGVGSGSFVPPTKVADPPGLTGTRWTQVTTGAFFTCALRDDGTLWCFGTSIEGQLGQGTMTGASALPLRVGQESDWRQVDAGLHHVCGVRGAPQTRGQLECWGYDSGDGRLGDGAATSRFAPTPVMDQGMIDWREVSAGYVATCGLDVAGALYCFGEQYHLPGAPVGATTPVRYGSATGVDGVAMGGFGGCIVDGGAVSCWGFNEEGAVGAAPPYGATEPTAVVGLGGAVRLELGDELACALDDGGTVSCWGDRGDGQLGDGVMSDVRAPAAVLGGHQPWLDVDIGVEHTCGVTANGEMWCWGLNDGGQLGGGNGATGPLHPEPVRVGESRLWDRVVAGARHGCALASPDRSLACWGANDEGQRGVGGASPVYEPTAVDGVALSALATGVHSSCGVAAGDGSRRCWGANDYAQLGTGVASGPAVTMPTAIPGGPAAWSDVAMGVATGCGISGGAQPGILYCWGENADGQAARDPMVDQPVIIPVQVPDPTPQIADGWIRASVALRHGCGILSENGTSGRLFCWGYNGSGERGDEGPSDHNLRQVGVDADWIDVDTGVAHTCALRSGGTLHCFGANSSGQLGDGSADSHALPGPTVGGMSDWVGVAAGNSTSCGIRGAARVLYCWGENHYGQVGDGNSVRWTPAPVPRP